MGGKSSTISTSEQRILSLQVQQSSQGLTLPVVYGRTRVAGNLVWYGDFTTYEHKTTTRQGGKGGGGVKQEDVKYTYEAAVMMALCEGEIKGVTRIWRDKEKFSSPASLRLTLYKGGEEQPVWPHLQQAKHAAQAISYSGTAYLCSPNYELTKSAQIYSHNFEVDGKLGYSTSIVDANPRDIIRDLLTNQKYGCGFPVENLGDTDVYGTYCRAAGIFLSPVYSEQQEAQRNIAELLEQTNSAAVFSQGRLKIVPYGDSGLSGNGATYIPNLTPLYDLSDDDFIVSGAEDPVRVERKTNADAYNQVQIEYLDRANDYNIAVAEAKDQANIEQYGIRPKDAVKMHGICDAKVARQVAQLLLQRALYVRNEYEFKLGWKYCLLEPMDLVTLTDGGLGLDKTPVRITEIEEDEDGVLNVKAEDFPFGTASATEYPTQPSLGYNDMTSAGSDSADGQTAAFGGFFSDTGEGFTGLLEKIGKVFDFFGAIIRTAVVFAIESFGDLWAAIQNGSVAAANFAIGSIERLVNSAIAGINRVIELANKVPGIGIGTVGEIKLGRNDAAEKPKAGRSINEIYAEEVARQQQGGLQQYFASKRPSGKSAGGGGGSSRRSVPSGGGGGGGRGRGGGGSGGAGGKNDQMQKWEAEIKAQKLAHEEMRVEGKTHADWDLNRERAYWKEKLSLVDAGGKDGVKIREKIVSLEHSLAKQSTEAKLRQVEEWEKADKYRLDLEAEAADQALSAGRISQLERLDLEIEFENRRYQIAYDALQERIALAEQDPTYSEAAVEKLKQQVGELDRGHSLNQEKNQGKREQQRRKDAPSLVEMLQDGGKNVWEEAQQQMGQAFSAMLSRAQNFRQAMGGLFSAIRQTFVQEMVSKPLAALMGRFAQEGAMWLANGARQVAAQSAASAAVTGIKETETTKNVGMNAIQAAAEAFKAMAGIPYVGPILAVGAAAAAMAAVYGLLGGMGGGGGGSTTTTTRIPSAAGGWDIPAGINPLTQLHENEMVLPAEHAQTIRDMAGQGGGGDTIVINTTGGDFIHKKDLAKLLKQLNRDFKIA